MMNLHPGKTMPFSYNNESLLCLQMGIHHEPWHVQAFLKEKGISTVNDLRN